MFGDAAYEITPDAIRTVEGTVGADPDQAAACAPGEAELHGDVLEPDGDFCQVIIPEPYDAIPEADRDGDPATPVVEHRGELAESETVADTAGAKVGAEVTPTFEAPAERIEAEPVAETSPEASGLAVGRIAGLGVLALSLSLLVEVARRLRRPTEG